MICLWRPRLIFLAVVEHRLIPARVRSQWNRLKRKGLAFYLGSGLPMTPLMLVMLVLVSLVCGVLLLLFLPLLLPSLKGSLIAVGRLGACFLLVWDGFMHLVVLYGYQGADTDAEQLAFH